MYVCYVFLKKEACSCVKLGFVKMIIRLFSHLVLLSAIQLSILPVIPWQLESLFMWGGLSTKCKIISSCLG